MASSDRAKQDTTVHVLWINAGLSCDGDSVALTAAMQPSIEDIAMGALPGLPKVEFHWPLVDYQVGAEFMEWFWRADAGTLDPFVLVVEGSIPNEEVKSDGYWSGFGNRVPGPPARSDQPMTTSEWLNHLALDSEGRRLFELFGERAQWADTVRPLLWTNTAVTVPSFRSAIEVDLPITCTYDLEVASTKYFHALEAGDISLLFLFSGTVFVKTPTGFSVEQIPWDLEATWRMPVVLWRDAMDHYFPDSAWLRLSRKSVNRLQLFKQRHALPTWEAAIDALLEKMDEAKVP